MKGPAAGALRPILAANETGRLRVMDGIGEVARRPDPMGNPRALMNR